MDLTLVRTNPKYQVFSRLIARSRWAGSLWRRAWCAQGGLLGGRAQCSDPSSLSVGLAIPAPSLAWPQQRSQHAHNPCPIYFVLRKLRLAQDGEHPSGQQLTRSSTEDPCCPLQGWLLAAHAAIVTTLATAVWLLRPPRRTYLVDWYSFRPPDRMAVSIDDMKDGIERKKVRWRLAPAALALFHGPWASTRKASGFTCWRQHFRTA